MLKKQKLYQQAGKRLISLHFTEKPRLRPLLAEKLACFQRLSGVGEALRSQPDDTGRTTDTAGAGPTPSAAD